MLDVEGRDRRDPAAEILTRRVLAYAGAAAIEPRQRRTLYLGGAEGEELLRLLRAKYEKVNEIPSRPALLVVGSRARPDASTLRDFLSRGGMFESQ